MRNTKQRDTILDIVKKSCDHPSAQTIYERAKNFLPSISLGTVYRNLSLLSQSGFIKRICLPNCPDRFDKTLVSHAHFHCLYCNKVLDIDQTFTLQIEENIEIVAPGSIVSLELVCQGKCINCH